MPHLQNNIYISWLIAIAVTSSMIVLLKPLSQRLGLVDHPGGRKQHALSTPLIGGVCMFLGFCFAVLTLHVSLQDYRSFLAGSALLVIVGVLDDMHELSHRSRFIAQILAALLMVSWGNNLLHNFGNLLFVSNIHLYNWALPVTVFAVVGVINAVNMTDGIDGLAASMALMQFMLLALLAFYSGDAIAFQIIAVLIVVIFAFLIFNFRIPGRTHAKVFMGDAGSMFIGFALAWFLVSLSQGEHPATRPVTMLWIMALPLFDTLRVMIVRVRRGESPFISARDHFHHLLVRRGFSAAQISLLASVFTLIFGLVGIEAGHLQLPDGLLFVGFVTLFCVFYFVVETFDRRKM